MVVVVLFVLAALRIRRHYDVVRAATALQPQTIEIPSHVVTPSSEGRDASSTATTEADPENRSDTDEEAEETPVEIRHLVIAPVAMLDRPAMRALAYAASLQQPVVALHVSPSEGEAERFRCYWHTWGDHLPLPGLWSRPIA